MTISASFLFLVFCSWISGEKRRAVFTYKVDNIYAPQAEASIIYNDPALASTGPIADSQLVMSEKDRQQEISEQQSILK